MQRCMSGEPTQTTNITVPTNLYERKNSNTDTFLSKEPIQEENTTKPQLAKEISNVVLNQYQIPKNETILENPMQSCMSGEPTETRNITVPTTPEEQNTLSTPLEQGILPTPVDQNILSTPVEQPTLPTPVQLQWYERENELILQPSDRQNIERVMQGCMNNHFMTKDFDFIWNPDEFNKIYPKMKHNNNGSSQSKKASKRRKPLNLTSNQESENQEISQSKVEIKSPQSKRSKTVLDSHEINEKQLEKPVKEKKKKSKAEMASEKFDERFKKAFENKESEKEYLKDSTKKQKQETKVKLQSLKMTSNTVPILTLMQKRPKKPNVRCS